MYSNPYDFQRPVKEPQLFAGRHQELKEAGYYLDLARGDSPRYFNLAIVGPRSSGKTSFLNMIQHLANERGFLSVKISLNNELVENDIILFKEIFDGIMTKGTQRGLFGSKGKQVYRKFRKIVDTLALNIQIPLLFGTAYIGTKKDGKDIALSQHVIVHDLKELHIEARKQKIPGIILLFDECDLLAKNETILQKIRNAFQEVEGYILVLSGTEKMFPLISEIFSPIPRFFKRVNIENFKDLNETKECILKPLDEEEAKIVDQNSIAEIHLFTGGSPYEINLVSHYMYKYYKETNEKAIKLTVEVLDDILYELERLRKSEHHEIATKIKGLWVPHLKVLISLIELGKTTKQALANYMLLDNLGQLTPRKAKTEIEVNQMNIDALEKAGIIKSDDNGKLDFVGDMFDFLYLKYSALTKGISEFFVGLKQEPIMNVHFKLLRMLLGKVQEYEFQGRFDKSGTVFETEHRGRLFVSGFHAKVAGKRTFTVVSPDIEKRFYLGSPKSVRFRTNIEYLKTGFVTQITFSRDEDKTLFESRLNDRMDKYELAGLNVILEDEIYWNNEGVKRLRQKKFTDSIEFFEKSIAVNPYFELPWLNKARALFALNDYEKALTPCEEALRMHPRLSGALNLKGRIFFHSGQYEEALPCFEKAVEFDPENWAAWDNIGRTLIKLCRYNEAIPSFDKVLQNNPTNLVVLGLKAQALACSGSLEEAIKYWDVILKNKPKEVNALTNKAHALLELNKNLESIEVADEVLKIDSKNPIALYNKACALSKLNKPEEAVDTLKQASILDINVLEKARTDKDFDNIRDHQRFIKLIPKN